MPPCCFMHPRRLLARGVAPRLYTGDIKEREDALRSLREFGRPVADIFQPMPYSDAQIMCASPTSNS